jgi:hypothetical protein
LYAVFLNIRYFALVVSVFEYFFCQFAEWEKSDHQMAALVPVYGFLLKKTVNLANTATFTLP